jgi:hypothetical protein
MVPACATNPCPAHQFIKKFFTYIFVMGGRAEYDSSCTIAHSCDTLIMAKVLSELFAEETRLKALSSSTGSMWQGVIPRYLVRIARTLIGLKIVC